MDLRGPIREVPDFPVPGTLFRDITPLLPELGGQAVGCAFLIELSGPRGRNCLAGRQVHSLVTYS